jgi:hypothetical protein
MKVVVFGAGAFGRDYIEHCEADTEIVAVCDNNFAQVPGTLCGHAVSSPEILKSLPCDRIVIALREQSPESQKHIIDMRDQLLSYGVPVGKILLADQDEIMETNVAHPRIEFLKRVSEDLRERGAAGAVAECGVCFGDFAYSINRFFPDRPLYLFDTFTSFDDRDRETENFEDADTWESFRTLFLNVNTDLVYLKMPYKDNVVLKKGYVPETFAGLEEERFCFVHLDMDLYAPTLAALRFFAGRIVDGGLILVHDYYVSKFDGVKRAVTAFENERPCRRMPIGDTLSAAITF